MIHFLTNQSGPTGHVSRLRAAGVHDNESVGGQGTGGPLTLKFDRLTRPFLKFNRRHWTLFKSTGK